MDELTEEERLAVIGAIHLAQDMYAETADDLAKQPHPEEVSAGRDMGKRLDVLDSARRKLGDTWEPDPRFKAPDTIEGLEG